MSGRKKKPDPRPKPEEYEPGNQTLALLSLANKPKIVHWSTHRHRLKVHPLEAEFAKMWEEQNEKHMALRVLLGDGTIGGWEKVHITQSEATAAATAIQWLGSPVGRCVLADVLRTEAGKNFLASYLGADVKR